MKALRIVLTQTSANYRKEESDKNKMTYPLPPFSTIIGAIHSACGFTEYKPMDISVQGNYKSMHREPYTDYCFLNSVFNDRGILVKMANDSMLSGAYTKVASAKKTMGNNFRTGVTIDIFNEELLKEYRDLLDLRDDADKFNKERLKPVLDLIKIRKKNLANKKKTLDKKDKKYEAIVLREKEIKSLEKHINSKFKKYKEENFEVPYSKFRSLVTSLKYYEILNDIELIIHVRADEEILETIHKNVYSIKSIGRSEDFVNIKEAEIVELKEFNERVKSKNSAYLSYEDVLAKNITVKKKSGGRICGTKYHISKNFTYEDINNKLIRRFNKCKVIYTSNYSIKNTKENLWIDEAINEKYIVNFI